MGNNKIIASSITLKVQEECIYVNANEGTIIHLSMITPQSLIACLLTVLHGSRYCIALT